MLDQLKKKEPTGSTNNKTNIEYMNLNPEDNIELNNDIKIERMGKYDYVDYDYAWLMIMVYDYAYDYDLILIFAKMVRTTSPINLCASGVGLTFCSFLVKF